ncbi:FtsK/SpoIIIE domain-containing protein [Enterococcus sp. C76]|uniref:FtsK/SpoIIIE domain-containing protein n=1 Tax=Enterococcus sp. C76 TaxID=3231334 RepID=UPI0034A07D23
MFKIFVYRGIRVRLYHCNLLRKWWLVFCVPFFMMLGWYHYKITYPLVSKMQGELDISLLFVPILVTVVVLILAMYVSKWLIETSKQKNGFFFRQYKKQLLAEYLNGNDIVEKKIVKSDGRQKEIRRLPKVYYRTDREMDEFTFKIGNKFQDKFLQIGRPLEDLFLADLVEIRREMGFISYRYLIDVISKRISLDKVVAENGRIKLMEGVYWEYDALPHMLITGGTGGGKTYFIYSLIYALGKEGRVHICDPKASDLLALGEFKAFKGLVVSDKEDIFTMLEEAVDLMEKRYVYMRNLLNYTIGKNYRYYGMKPEFFIIDEWAAFVSTLGGYGSTYSEEKLYEKITPLVLKGRQAGVFLVIATQKAGTDVLKSAIRDNLMCKVSLGVLSETGYIMTFGEDHKNKAFINKHGVKGRGYIDIGLGIPNEFYAPFVSADFDFVEFFRNMPEMSYTNVLGIEITKKEQEILDEFYGDDFIEREWEQIRKNQSDQVQKMVREKNEKADKLMAQAQENMSYSEQVKQRRSEGR